MIKENATAKFNESIDVAVNLGIDAKKSDQAVRGSVVLPAGTGKTVRVAVFAQGDKAEEARSGRRHRRVSKIWRKGSRAGDIDFDVVIASPDAMRIVGQLGQILGSARPDAEPEGRHGNAGRCRGGKKCKGRSGSVSGRQGGYRPVPDRPRIVQRRGMTQNLLALLDALNKSKPATSKGIYLRKISISSTMGIGVRVDQTSMR